MSRKTLSCFAVVAGGLLALAGVSAGADDRKGDKDQAAPSGVWARADGQTKLEFADKETLKIFPHGDNAAIALVCRYTTGKDGLVKAKVTDFEGSDEVKDKLKNILPAGTEFRFKWQTKGDSATLEDVQADRIDALKPHLEGKYEKK